MATTSYTDELVSATGPRPVQKRRWRLAGVVAAAAGALFVWGIASRLLGVDLDVRQGSGLTTVGPGSVVVMAALAGLVAWLVLAGLEKVTKKAAAVWTTVAVVVAVLSLAGPAMSAVGTGALVSLAAMHLVVAGVVVAAMLPTARRR